jgi:hypothetical protein
MMDTVLVYIAVLCLFLTAIVKIGWGYLSVTEGRQERSWKAYFFDWEFSLGGTLFSSALMFLFFALYASSAALQLFDVPAKVWVYSFVALSINLALWSTRSGYIWYRRRFNS